MANKTQDQNDLTDKSVGSKVLALIPLGIALNILLGTAIHTLKMPIYMDACGTILVTLLAGWRAGVVVGVASFLLGGMLTNPVLPWFAGTQAAIALYTHFVASRGGLRTYPRIILSGIGLGVVAGVASAPVIVYLFGGITGSGPSLIVAFMLASGKSILNSVLLSGLAAEPLDKTLQLLLAVWLLRGMPRTLLQKFDSRLLATNGLTNAAYR
ncbi:MAG: hypothetical protein V4568_08885 [Pseudomonadota bacterium]